MLFAICAKMRMVSMAKKPVSDADKALAAARRSRIAIEDSSVQLEMELVRFRADDGELEIRFDVGAETVWATQQQMAFLFGCAPENITDQLSRIYADQELDRRATIKEILVVRDEGGRQVRRGIEHFNLDVILSVGYRVSSTKATKFRQWATTTLKAYLVDGYALNERRLSSDPNALRRLAAEVRRLRSDEIQIYQAVRDCFKIAATDYDPGARETKRFYATLQDKFLYAVTGKSASELILDRADGFQPNMGSKALKGTGPTIQEAKIGKNYLDGEELYQLHILCELFLLYAETKAIRGQPLIMQQLLSKLDELLTLNEYPVFDGYREFLRNKAMEHAEQEFELFKERLMRGEALPAPSVHAVKRLPNRRKPENSPSADL